MWREKKALSAIFLWSENFMFQHIFGKNIAEKILWKCFKNLLRRVTIFVKIVLSIIGFGRTGCRHQFPFRRYLKTYPVKTYVNIQFIFYFQFIATTEMATVDISYVRIFCLKLKNSITTKPIDFSFNFNLHIIPVMVLECFVFWYGFMLYLFASYFPCALNTESLLDESISSDTIRNRL